MKSSLTALLVATVLHVSSVPAAAQVQLSMQNGRVTLVARDATLRQILAEWARVGQTRIVNAERVMGGALSFELIDVPEKQALDIVLRSVSGYVAAARPTLIANGSHFDRILVLPTPAQARTTSAPSAVPPPLPQPRIQPFPVERDFDLPPPGASPALRPPVGAPNPPSAPPLTPQPPGSAVPIFAPPPAAGAGSPSAVPVGASAPGVILQPPAAPTSPASAPTRRF